MKPLGWTVNKMLHSFVSLKEASGAMFITFKLNTNLSLLRERGRGGIAATAENFGVGAVQRQQDVSSVEGKCTIVP
jgi:hypothetical protein